MNVPAIPSDPPIRKVLELGVVGRIAPKETGARGVGHSSRRNTHN